MNVLKFWAVVAALAGGLSVQAAQIQIGFQEVRGPVPDSYLFGTPDQELARQAITNRYGTEHGFIRVQPSGQFKLAVLTTHKHHSRTIWDKMQRNGDAFVQGGIAYYVYDNGQPTPPTITFQNVGRITMWEGETGSIPLYGFPHVTTFMVRVPQECSVSRGTVTKANQLEQIQGTKLSHTERDGNTIKYIYVVNGGIGTQVSHLSVTFAPARAGLFRPITNCDVQFFLPINGGAVPESASAPAKP